jgi:hypothetical protein
MPAIAPSDTIRMTRLPEPILDMMANGIPVSSQIQTRKATDFGRLFSFGSSMPLQAGSLQHRPGTKKPRTMPGL